MRVEWSCLAARAQIAVVGLDFRVENSAIVLGGENIRIGDGFRALDGLHLYAQDGLLTVGDNCSLNSNVQLGAAQGTIHIGDNVLIGPNTVLRAADHGFAGSSSPRTQPHQRGTILVEDDVWIGANCVVTRNVTIGRGAVVAAGSVVTRDIESNVVAGGIPARIIRRRTSGDVSEEVDGDAGSD